MRIGIDLRSLERGHRSGVGVYTYNLVSQLLRLDQKNEYYLFYNSFRNFELPPVFMAENVKPVFFNYPNKILNAGFFFLNRPFIDKLISRKIEKQSNKKNDLDIFWTPNWNFSSVSKKVKKVLTIHDLSPLICPEFLPPLGRLWHKMLKIKKTINDADRIIAVSENTKRDLAHFFPGVENKTTVVYEGVENRFKKIDKNDFVCKKVKEKYNLPDNFILYLGNLEPRKNIITIIESFELLKRHYQVLSNLKLVLAGGVPVFARKYDDKIKEVISHKLFANDIIRLGYVEEADKVALYNLAKIFVFPSWHEGFGLPVVESMASGTPVIASKNSSFLEIGRNAAILVDPNSISELAFAMNEILITPEFAERLRERGIVAAKDFSWEKAAKETLDVFQNLI